MIINIIITTQYLIVSYRIVSKTVYFFSIIIIIHSKFSHYIVTHFPIYIASSSSSSSLQVHIAHGPKDGKWQLLYCYHSYYSSFQSCSDAETTCCFFPSLKFRLFFLIFGKKWSEQGDLPEEEEHLFPSFWLLSFIVTLTLGMSQQLCCGVVRLLVVNTKSFWLLKL